MCLAVVFVLLQTFGTSSGGLETTHFAIGRHDPRLTPSVYWSVLVASCATLIVSQPLFPSLCVHVHVWSCRNPHPCAPGREAFSTLFCHCVGGNSHETAGEMWQGTFRIAHILVLNVLRTKWHSELKCVTYMTTKFYSNIHIMCTS